MRRGTRLIGWCCLLASACSSLTRSAHPELLPRVLTLVRDSPPLQFVAVPQDRCDTRRNVTCSQHCSNIVWICQTPVTQQMYFLLQGLCVSDTEKTVMQGITWIDAMRVCEQLTIAAQSNGFLSATEEVRLPTRAECASAVRHLEQGSQVAIPGGSLYEWSHDAFCSNDLAYAWMVETERSGISPKTQSPLIAVPCHSARIESGMRLVVAQKGCTADTTRHIFLRLKKATASMQIIERRLPPFITTNRVIGVRGQASTFEE